MAFLFQCLRDVRVRSGDLDLIPHVHVTTHEGPRPRSFDWLASGAIPRTDPPVASSQWHAADPSRPEKQFDYMQRRRQP